MRDSFGDSLGDIASSYQTKMVLVAVVLLVVVGTISFFFIGQTGDTLTQETQSQLGDTSTTQAESAGVWIESIDRQTTLLSSADPLYEDDEVLLQSYLEQQDGELGEEVAALHYVDTSGDEPLILSSSDESAIDTEVTAPWSDTLNTQFTTPDTVAQSGVYTDDGPQMAFVSPVPDQDDRAIVIITDLTMASEYLTSPQDGHSFIMSGDGEIMLSTDSSLIGENAVDVEVASQDVFDTVAGEPGSSTITFDGEEYVSSYDRASHQSVIAVSQQPTATAYELRDNVVQFVTLLVGAIVLIGGVGIGVLFAYPTIKHLKRLRDETDAIAAGNLDNKITSSRRDEIGQLYRSLDQMRSSLKMQLDEQKRANKQMNAAVEEGSKVMKQIGEGNFTVRIDADGDLEAMNQLSRNFNRMMDDVEALVTETIRFGEQVDNSVQNVKTAVDQIESGTAEVSDAMEDIDAGAEMQDEKINTAHSSMNDLSALIEEVASSADELAAQSNETAEQSVRIRESAQEAVGELSEIEQDTDEAVAEMKELEDEMDELTDIAEVIGQIAQQTNMLAINAGIEASRAGEAGEGFGVVADEVKSLADQTAERADEIESSLKELQEQARNTTESIEETQETVEKGSSTIQDVLEGVNTITGSVDETNASAQEISDATSEQADKAQNVVVELDDVDKISKSTAEKTTAVSSTMQEQAASVKQVSAEVSEMAANAERLQSLLDQFEIETERDIMNE